MRARLLFTGLALTAAVLAGGATAHATPLPSQAGPAAEEAAETARGRWVREGVYSESTCYSLVASYAGPAYCTPASGKNRFALYIWVEDSDR
ncbi:hypothetical protein ACFV7Q_35505 [Streptomyces sp. NPDC059851]|uniref:hypothetical protein n=1 Tax=Streptomyces sp. NPDC059851 TaxID=3346971 RepID=UPI003649B163